MAESAAVAPAEQSPEPQPQHIEPANASHEMSDLQTNSAYATPAEEHPPATMTPADAPSDPTQSSQPPLQTTQPTTASLPQSTSQSSHTAQDEPIQPSKTTESAIVGPVIHIILLLTTGARHPYKIDNKYLRKRDVNVEKDDPFNISVYTLKELIWRDWRRAEWEPRPSSPAYIRLITMGRMLDDKLALKDCRFNHDAPNIVHMTVKPQDILEEDDSPKSGRNRGADGEEATAGCRCVIL